MAAPQWFSLGAQLCNYYTHDYTEKRRSAFLAMLLGIQAKHKNFYILDLLDVMCPGEICTFQGQNGVYLYRDESSHPSVEANRLATPVFLSTVRRAIVDLRSN